jgi:ArsR family transcriptional regulator, arsenate/arsenite/antimonite-responsive transcriptional repressor
MMKTGRLDQLFKAVSDHTRLRLLNLLRLGSICVCDLQAVLQIPQSRVSRHLTGLRHAGLVMDCRSGNKIIYSLAATGTPQIAAIYDLLAKSCPCDEVMRADISRLKKAVRMGECCLDQYPVPTELPVSIVEKRF